jgi:RNA polymerase sigma factor (sigma-70 family)
MGEPLAASANEVLATEPVIRRVVAARVANPSDVDDLVQDCLERLLGARNRLAPEMILPFGIVTARNLVTSHARTAARHATAAPRLVDLREPERPEDRLLLSEQRIAMTTALTRLSPEERRDVLAYYDDEPRSQRTGARESPGALRVRMARTRAKLRLEYLLAFRHVTLPEPVCRRVLLAVSAGDTRRQRELDAGQHLLDCETCSMLSEPLEQRSAALTAITLPPALAAWAVARARAHPGQTAAATVAAAAAAAAVAAGLAASRPAEAPRLPAASPVTLSRPAQPAIISGLLIGSQSVPQAEVQHSLRGQIGQPVAASGVVVQQTVTRDGFWIGYGRARIWVELTGPLKPLRIVANDRLRFVGTVVKNVPSYAAQAGVSSNTGAALLSLQGAHIDVSTTRVSVESPKASASP